MWVCCDKEDARGRAAIGRLDSIIVAGRGKGGPADRIIAEYFRARRYAGSKDRRAVRDLVYRAIRLCGPVPVSGRAAMLAVAGQEPAIAALFDGSPHGPAPRKEGEEAAKTGLAPKWLAATLRASGLGGREIAALMDRAPLDIRVNALKADRATLELPEAGGPLAAPQALRFASGTPVETWEAYGEGLGAPQVLKAGFNPILKDACPSCRRCQTRWSFAQPHGGLDSLVEGS